MLKCESQFFSVRLGIMILSRFVFSQPKLLQHSNLKIMAFHRQYYGGLPLIGGCWRCCMHRDDTLLMITSFKPKENIHSLECASFFQYGHEHHVAPLRQQNFSCLWLRTFCFSLLWKVSRLICVWLSPPPCWFNTLGKRAASVHYNNNADWLTAERWVKEMSQRIVFGDIWEWACAWIGIAIFFLRLIMQPQNRWTVLNCMRK